MGLYLLFILTFSVPAVQEFMGRKAAGMLAQKLGTSVSIGRLDYGIPSHVTLYDVLIKDQQGKELLKATRLSTRIDLMQLAEGQISVATAQLFGAHAKLYRATADSKPNFQFVIDSLASKDTTSTSPLNLRINSLIIRRSSVTYDRLDAEETPGVINPNHLALTDISTHIILKLLTEDSLNVNIKRLSAREKSGMAVDRLSLHFDGGRHGCQLTDFKLRMPGTDVSLGDIKASYRFRGDHFVTPSLRYSGSIRPSTVRLSDLSYLLPSLKTFQSTLSLSANFKGEGENLEIPQLNVNSTTGDIDINIGGTIHQLTQQAPNWTVNIHDLGLSAKTIDFISENLQGRSVQVPEALVRLGSIHLKGTASGHGTSELRTTNQLKTDAGMVNLQLSMDSLRHFKGSVDTPDFDLKRLLNDDHFGQLATNVQLSGQLPAEGQPTVKAEGVVNHIHYNGYRYQNIQLNGLYSPTDIHGQVSIDDHHLKAVINGNMLKQQRQNDILLNVDIDELNPKAIHLSDQWGDAHLSGNLAANFKTIHNQDVVGTLDINELTLQSPTTDYKLQQLHIESGYNGDQHYASMHSDFGDVNISGHFDYLTLPQSITNFIASKLPTLPGLPKTHQQTHNDFTLHATIRKSDWLQSILQIPVRLTKPLTIDGTVNDDIQQINMECNVPQFYYKDSRYDSAHVSILSPMGTLAYDLSINKHKDNGNDMALQAAGSAFNNQLTTTLRWDNHATERMSGEVKAKAQFDTTLDGKQVTFVQLEPSKIMVNNAEWDIHPSSVTYYAKHLDIKDFAIQRNEQFLTLNGTASENESDSIAIQMRDIDIEYILDLVNFDAVSFSGQATGGGCLRGIFGNLEADAMLTVNQFKFQDGRMGTLHAKVNWNPEQEQIDIHATADDGPKAQTLIEGYVSPKRNYIDLDIEAQGTHLEFARSFMSSFISQLDGHANGRVRLAGALDALNITGKLVINGLAHVIPLGCSYELIGDTITLIPNEIIMTHFPVYDINGTQAMLSGSIQHEELTNLTFDLFVKTENLLAYHFSNFGTDTFYGTVFATGEVAIKGREDGITIDADITPQNGTVFVYNAASPDVITNQEFIQWGKPAVTQTANDGHATATAVEKNALTYRDDLVMRLKINANPQASIRLLMDAKTNDYITLRGNGILQSTYYNKGGFTMFGTYRVTEGTYGITIQNIIRKNFTFREGGTIVFGGDPYDATLNLQAQHTVNGVSLSDLNVGRSFANTVRVNCLMNISGQPRQPIIDFDLEMPNVNADEQQMVRSIINSEEEMNQQVIYLLAVGRFYPQNENNANATENSRSKTSLAMQSLLSGTISGQINNMLGQIVKSNKWNFGANISTGDEGWNNAEYEGLVSGRLLNNRLLLNGQFGYRDNAKTTNPSFIGDFDIRYLLKPNGNLALKVYNQTNDRYFTRSSLNTQGIGIILKRDFDGIPDLFGIKKKQKTKEK